MAVRHEFVYNVLNKRKLKDGSKHCVSAYGNKKIIPLGEIMENATKKITYNRFSDIIKETGFYENREFLVTQCQVVKSPRKNKEKLSESENQ